MFDYNYQNVLPFISAVFNSWYNQFPNSFLKNNDANAKNLFQVISNRRSVIGGCSIVRMGNLFMC